MRSSTWLRINSRVSHRVVAGVALCREAITEEEETEEGVGQEELAVEEGAEDESGQCGLPRTSGQLARNQEQDMH